MDTAEERPAPRIRERSAKPMRAPWTYRCRLRGPNVAIDVDAFSVKEAAAAAATHWGVGRDDVDVEGQRRRWMRWIGRSTHEAGDRVALERSWWLWSKVAVVVFVVALPTGFVVGSAVAETLKLHLEVKQAELEHLEAANAASRARVPAEERAGG